MRPRETTSSIAARMVRSRPAAVATASAAALATIAGSAAPQAGAAGYPNQVSFANYVGMIGNFTGCPGTKQYNTVRGLQAMLWASGSYGTPTSGNKNVVDGIWGNGTKQAVNVYQFWNGIGIDGCAGWNTTTAMRNQWHRVYPDLNGGYYVTQRYNYQVGSGPQVRMARDMAAMGCYWYNWNGWKSWDPWQTRPTSQGGGGWGDAGCADGGGGYYSGPLWSW